MSDTTNPNISTPTPTPSDLPKPNGWLLICPPDNYQHPLRFPGEHLDNYKQLADRLGLVRTVDPVSRKFYLGQPPTMPKMGPQGTVKPPQTLYPVLEVYPYQQYDSATDEGGRMCFSSSCAMLLNYLLPGKLTGVNGDDQYLKRLHNVAPKGDTTLAGSQLQALASYGVQAQFSTGMSWATVDKQLELGFPVPVGGYHRGHVSNLDRNRSHWVLIYGKTSTGYLVHDPGGEQDLVNGGFVPGKSGAGVHYSKKNFGPRWLADGANSGWGIIATSPAPPANHGAHK